MTKTNKCGFGSGVWEILNLIRNKSQERALFKDFENNKLENLCQKNENLDIL